MTTHERHRAVFTRPHRGIVPTARIPNHTRCPSLAFSAVQRRAECEQWDIRPTERKVRKRWPARPETNVWFICNPIRLAAAYFTPRLTAAVGLFAIRETLRTACHCSTSCALVDRDVRNVPIAINGVLVQIRVCTRCTNVARSLARSHMMMVLIVETCMILI